MENADLKGQIQEKVFVTTAFQSELSRLKGKHVFDNATTIAPEMFKLDIEPLFHRLKNNRDAHEDYQAHIDYLKHTQEQADILRGIVEQAKAKQPLDNALDFACCPDCSLVSGLQMFKTYNREPLSAHELRNVIFSREYYVEGLGHNLFTVGKFYDADLEVAFWTRHELCFLKFVSDMNASSKSKSVKKAKKKEEWKPTGKVFTKIGYNWRPTGRTFTLVGNACPLTRITATNKVPLREPIPL
ncbi:hypothetical protein Tco_1564266 [Tanacetum coccineum]